MGIARKERVAGAIKAAIAEFLILNLANSTPGFISVSKVRVTPDLKLAYVYFSIYGNEKDIAYSFKVLEGLNGRVRYHVGNEVPLKYVPKLKFFIDDSLEYTDKMNQVMKDI